MIGVPSEFMPQGEIDPPVEMFFEGKSMSGVSFFWEKVSPRGHNKGGLIEWTLLFLGDLFKGHSKKKG